MPAYAWPLRLKIAAAVAVAVAGTLFVLAALSMDTEGESPLGAPVEALSPEPRSSVVRQVPVRIDLEAGWTGELTLNGKPIPDDQLTRDQGLGTITFVPGPGKAVERLQAGRNCATARVWSLASGPASTRSVTWCFEAA
ncbi:MAG: hypothetical protein KatS3mg008_1855 [Acidimicrobiales bacterium]|nr:MAG: hypothetical protein KatS3mg008_1855 [Acidimicrobiales bacterium]